MLPIPGQKWAKGSFRRDRGDGRGLGDNVEKQGGGQGLGGKRRETGGGAVRGP